MATSWGMARRSIPEFFPAVFGLMIVEIIVANCHQYPFHIAQHGPMPQLLTGAKHFHASSIETHKRGYGIPVVIEEEF
jgi:hypothetical protein